MSDPRADDPTQLAADGDDIPDGVDEPTEAERLQYLADHGWPT